MTVVVTPVGTSLFTNGTDQTKRRFDVIKDQPVSKWDQYNSYVGDNSRLRTESKNFIQDKKASASAELQSIAKIQDEFDDDIEVRLLASDTIASRLAAEILMNQGNVLGSNVSVKFDGKKDVIKGLQIKSTEDFSNLGMPNLMRRISEFCDKQLAINITGGYKATVPYLTILSQIRQIPLFYTFDELDDESPDLIKIPQVPLSVNWQLVKQYTDVFSKIDEGVSEWQEFRKEHRPAIKELRSCIEVADDLAILSWFGEEFWSHYKGNFLVKINAKIYFARKVWKDSTIDTAIQNLYKQLSETLSNSSNGFKKPPCSPNCFSIITDLDQKGNLNHGGPINDKTFIFKSQSQVPIRFPYSFEVAAQEIESITIFDILRGDFNHNTYVKQFIKEYKNPTNIDFVERIMPKLV